MDSAAYRPIQVIQCLLPLANAAVAGVVGAVGAESVLGLPRVGSDIRRFLHRLALVTPMLPDDHGTAP